MDRVLSKSFSTLGFNLYESMSRVCTYFPFCGILCHTCSTMSGESHWSRYRRKQGPWLISQHSLLRCSVVHPAESWTCIMCMFPIYLIHGGKSLQNQSWKPWRKTNLLLVWKKLLYPGEETTRFFFFLNFRSYFGLNIWDMCEVPSYTSKFTCEIFMYLQPTFKHFYLYI